ncbi:MAG: AlkZ family DNA glycosylase [Streptosporangiaceae bacterium]|nr:AlkZ family DNA glycosylase [Streptosporangiaceae bacterium]
MSVTDHGVLGLRELNRALLARQLLLERVPQGPSGGGKGPPATPLVATVEHLVGLQAQAPFPPYYGLWSRLAGFRPEDLAALLTDRGVVRIALMRGTIHLVSARDCLPLRWLIQPVIDRMFRTNHGKRLPGVDLGELAAAGRELVESEPMTFGKLGEALGKRWPDHPPGDLAQGVRALVPLVQVPPRAVWGRSGQSLHTSAESWLGRPPATEPDLTELVTRYLAAFGPATVRDIQAWSGLTGLRGVVDALRPALVTFRSEGGAELFDLPDAPRPPGDTPAPVRLVAEFDNLVLSHADRTRIITEEHRGRLYTINGIFPGTVLIDGFVAGMWRLITGRGAATLTIEVWEPETAAERDELITEGERLLAFAAPGDVHDIRFAPIATAAPRLPHPGPPPVEG